MHKREKFLTVILIAEIMFFGVFTACDNNNDPTNPSNGKNPGATVAAPTLVFKTHIQGDSLQQRRGKLSI